MDDNDFKKHLKDLAHGHHHPEEHDWSPETPVRMGGAATAAAKTPKKAKAKAAKTKRPARKSRSAA